MWDLFPPLPPKKECPQPIFKEEAVQRITELLIDLANEEAENPLEEIATGDSGTSTTSTITLAYVLVKRQKLLEFYVKKLVEDIFAYCHRCDFPEPLINTAVELIMKHFRNETDTAESGTSAPLSEIKQDDTSLKFAVNTVNLSALASVGFFNQLKPNLNLYRRVKSL